MMQSPSWLCMIALVPYQHTFLFFLTEMNKVHDFSIETHMLVETITVFEFRSLGFVVLKLDRFSCSAIDVHLIKLFCYWMTSCGFGSCWWNITLFQWSHKHHIVYTKWPWNEKAPVFDSPGLRSHSFIQSLILESENSSILIDRSIPN